MRFLCIFILTKCTWPYKKHIEYLYVLLTKLVSNWYCILKPFWYFIVPYHWLVMVMLDSHYTVSIVNQNIKYQRCSVHSIMSLSFRRTALNHIFLNKIRDWILAMDFTLTHIISNIFKMFILIKIFILSCTFTVILLLETYDLLGGFYYIVL